MSPIRRLVFMVLVLGLAVQSPHRGVTAPESERVRVHSGGRSHGEVVFKSGDVVFRRGQGVVSRAVLTVDVGSGYSHAGLIRRHEGETWVIHASPGESLAQETTLLTESFDDFRGPFSTALYRPSPEFEEIAARAAEIAHGYALEGRTFDPRFDLESESELYCTELVWKAYLEAGLDLVEGEIDEIRLPLFQKRCLLPSQLLRSPYLQMVYEFHKKEP